MIDLFIGKYEYLSNFYYKPFVYDGVKYTTVEHAFQSLKTLDPEERKAVLECDTPGKAKRMGRKVHMRSDWEDIKIQLMHDLVYAKFSQNEYIKNLLIETGDEELAEGTTWHDKFWGIDIHTHEGENHLGKILMQVREELK